MRPLLQLLRKPLRSSSEFDESGDDEESGSSGETTTSLIEEADGSAGDEESDWSGETTEDPASSVEIDDSLLQDNEALVSKLVEISQENQGDDFTDATSELLGAQVTLTGAMFGVSRKTASEKTSLKSELT